MVGKILQKFVPRTVATSGVPYSPAVAIKIREWKVVSRELVYNGELGVFTQGPLQETLLGLRRVLYKRPCLD